MPFNGSGTFSLTYSWVTEQASSPIEISKLDTQEQDIADALSNCILRDGTGKPTADQDWNGQDLTNAGKVQATAAGGGNNAGLSVTSTVPALSLYETDGGTDEKGWDFAVDGEQFLGRAYNDAVTFAESWLVVERSGYVITRVFLGNTGVVRWPQRSSDPGSAQNGDTYYNTSTHKFRGYANGSWVDLN